MWPALACKKHKDALLYPHRFGTRPEHQTELDDRRRRNADTPAGKREPIQPIHVYGTPGSRPAFERSTDDVLMTTNGGVGAGP